MNIGPVSLFAGRTETKIQFRVLVPDIGFVLGNVINVLLLSAATRLQMRTGFGLSDYRLCGAQRLRGQELHIKLYVEFTSVRTLFWLANEKARERIGVDAVRGVGPLRMIRGKVNRTAVAAGLGTSHQCTGYTEVVGNTVTTTDFCVPSYSVTRPPALWARFFGFFGFDRR